jgi:hypothetical protein
MLPRRFVLRIVHHPENRSAFFEQDRATKAPATTID